jgi:hypothetical protein
MEPRFQAVKGGRGWRKTIAIHLKPMKKLPCSVGLALALPMVLNGRAADSQELEALKKELRELRQRTEQLERKIEQYEKTKPASPPSAPTPTPSALVPPPSPGVTASDVDVSKRWSPSDPIRLLGNQRNFLDLSLDGLFAAGTSTAEDVERLQPGSHDPKLRGFTVQNVEAIFQGAVDPYFRAQAALIFQIDSSGESAFELEEAYLETTALPANLQLRGGQFFSEFGRLNPTHPHSWSFVDQSLVNARFLGGDGLRNPGARLSWLMPTPFYSEFFVSIQNSQGETASSFRNENEGEPLFGRPPEVGRVKTFSDLLLVPRYAASFDLTESQTLLFGASAAYGPNSAGGDTDTQIYGMDVFWKWRPENHNAGFPFVSWQTEAMLRRYQVGQFSEDADGNGLLDLGELDLNGDAIANTLPRETFTDYGVYSQVVYGFRKGWTTGVRYDYVTRKDLAEYELVYGPDPARDRRWRLSPNLTWYPTEFSKVRLQYNLDHRQHVGKDHSVWLQFEFLLGSHAAHKF